MIVGDGRIVVGGGVVICLRLRIVGGVDAVVDRRIGIVIIGGIMIGGIVIGWRIVVGGRTWHLDLGVLLLHLH